MATAFLFDGTRLLPLEAPSRRQLRWCGWRPDGAYALIVGNRGEAWRFDGRRFEPLATGVRENLRGAAWSPDGRHALVAGNRGAVLAYDGAAFEPISATTAENLRRVGWAPDAGSALIVGNGGVVLHFDAARRALVPVPGDRAHTMRSIAWRPDGAYALIGAYASSYAGYPRPHLLYRCDGRYTQGVLATDVEDDALAVEWRPRVTPSEATVVIAAYAGDGRERAASHRIVTHDGVSVQTRPLPAARTVLGFAWHPSGEYALGCGEGGELFRYAPSGETQPIVSGVGENLVGPFWHPSGESALLLRGPDERVYTV
jgi:hypothetical protein